MRVSLPTRLGFLVVALSLIVGSLPVRAADTEAAKRQYAAAAALQNRGVFNLAAEAWVKFIEDHPNDSRLEMAFHYLGVCYLKSNEYDLARQSFETLLETYPKFKLREATYLYLGVAQYSLAQKGQPKQYAAAAKTFETLLQQFPKGEYVPQAIFYLGECEYAQNHKKEAALQYARLVKEHPKSSLAADALYALGVTQEEMGDMDEAGKTYASFLERFPKNSLATEVGMRLGETLFATKKYEEAAKRFAQAAETSGFALADHALFRQAATVAELKQYPEAAALYASVATRFPKSQYANLARLAAGKCFYLAGDFDAAREQLKALLDAGGKLAPEAAHWIARSLLKQGQPAEALATVEKVLSKADKSPLLSQLLMDQAEATYETPKGRGPSIAQFADIAKKYPDDPLAPQARYMAAFASLEEGKFKDALNHADAFLAKDAGNKLQPDVMYVAAESHLQLGQLKEAEKLYGQLIEDQGDSPDVLSWTLRRGLVLHMQKKYQEVISVLKPVLGKFKDRDAVAEAQYLLGSSHAELKQYEPARAALEASLAANPKWRQSDDVLLILAHLYRQQGNLEKAQATVRQLIDTFPKSRLLDRAHYRLGEYAYALGDFQKAAAGYQKMLEKWPKSPLTPYALYGLGWAQLSRKEYAEAEKTLSTLIEKHPDDKLVPRARYARGMARQQQKNHGPAIEDLEAILVADPTPEEKSDAR